MINEFDVTQKIQDLRGSGKSFAEFIVEILKDKFVEVYLGDTYEEVSTEQISIEYPAVFCGKVIGAYRECLIISAAYVGSESKKIKLGNLMFINERAIRALSPVQGQGNIEDMFLRSKEAATIEKVFNP
jgi:hypothetical protein